MEDTNVAATNISPAQETTEDEKLTKTFGDQLNLDRDANVPHPQDENTKESRHQEGGDYVIPPNSDTVTDDHVGENKTEKCPIGEDTELDTIFGKSKQLALNKEFHAALIGDPVFCPFLVLALTSDSGGDVIRALEVFQLLALNPESSAGLSKVLHFFDGLKAASGNQKLPKEVRDFAQVVHQIVKESRKVPLKAQSRTKQNELRGAEHGSSTKKTERGAAGPSKRNQSGTKGKGVDLYVPMCIFKEKRLKMTEALLTLQGIISITYDLKKCHCLIRAKSHIPNELFGKSIANLGFECHLFTRVDNQETLTKMEPDPKLDSTCDKENWAQGRQSPQYLSDTDSELSFQEGQAQAVAIVGGDEAGKGKKKGGWFSSAANYIQKSLYW